jgi:hypothetical protein
MAGMAPLLPEEYYLAASFLIGGFSYIWLGSVMAIKPRDWLNHFFSLMPTTQKRAAAVGMTVTSAFSIRLLGISFATISALMIREGVQHAFYIYSHP